MALPIKPPYPPMEAKLVEAIPDGRRAGSTSRSGTGSAASRSATATSVELQSKAGQPLARYFPGSRRGGRGAEAAKKFVLDGEIVVPVDGELSFDDLLQRIHPAASRIKKLVAARRRRSTSCSTCSWTSGAARWSSTRCTSGATALEAFARRAPRDGSESHPPLARDDRPRAGRSNGSAPPAATLDGVIAKRLDCDYRSGDRDGMQKIKNLRTAECVVGGFRYGSKATKTLGSLLLGLYDDDGLLHHVGFCSSLTAKQRDGLTPKIEKLRKPTGEGRRLHRQGPGRAEPLEHRAQRRVGAARPRSSSSRCSTTTSPAAASATAPSSSAGVPTSRRSSARWTR